MLQSAVLLGLALASGVSARKCRDVNISISLTSQNAILDLEPLTSEIQVTNFYLELAKQGGNYFDRLFKGWTTVTGNYTLAATYCEPDSGPGPALQIMTHGIGFDRTYWDFPAKDYHYSYVGRAVDDYGYSTLTWDRLGVGMSSHGESITEIQMFLEIAALKALTEMAKSGTVCDTMPAFDTIIHLGHSFGSAMTYNLAKSNPELSSAIVLTGFSQVPAYMGHFALGGNFMPVKKLPLLEGRYPKGYVAAGSKMAMQQNFFAPGDFDPEVLDYLNEHAQPNTPGEIITVGAGGGDVNGFTGPCMVITGDRDVPFCGGDCTSTTAINHEYSNLIEVSAKYFPKSSAFNATVVPNAGHGLFLGYSSISAVDSILQFLDVHL